jgi:uncharacterized SAM-binding protein YcdF (DUF218 family)
MTGTLQCTPLPRRIYGPVPWWLIVLLLWCLGFLGFAQHSAVLPEARLSLEQLKTQEVGIAMLTGGAARIAEGIEVAQLLVRAPLLLSGVGSDASIDAILRAASVPTSVLSDRSLRGRITMGHLAENTLGNIEEIEIWARWHRVTRVVLVTSDYHMPRSLLLARSLVPSVEFIPWPVASEHFYRLENVPRLWMEYHKYLLAWGMVAWKNLVGFYA